MKRFFYSRLAWNGIRKNRQTYLPYILTCIGTVSYTHLDVYKRQIVYRRTFGTVEYGMGC